MKTREETRVAGRLNGKIAVITGGCSGIGFDTTELFVADGAQIVIADLQDEKGAALEQRFAGKLVYAHCDVTSEADIAAAIAKAASAFGGLDVLFNNPGTNVVRAGRPEDIALAALYLASDDSRFTTGIHLVVDGGLTAGGRTSWDETAFNPLMRALAAEV